VLVFELQFNSNIKEGFF